MKGLSFLRLPLLFLFQSISSLAQVSHGASAAYGLRKIIPAYTGNALQVRRTCDNATKDIGFTSCGDLDTNALKTFVLAANPLSAISSSAEAVYSLRRMYCTYAGPAIRVRSTAVGSPTTDIGFTASGDLDTVSLKTFAGTNSAFIITWYDQGAGAYHALQATTNAQPRIMNAGLIDKQNGRPSFYFDGTDDFLQNNAYSLLLNGQTPTWNAVMVPVATNGSYAAIVSWRYAGGVVNQLEFGSNNNWNTSWWSNSNYATTNGLAITNNSFQIITSIYNSASNQLYLNGTLSYNNTSQTNPAAISTNPNGCAATPLIIGNDNCCGGRFIKGYLFEIVLSSVNFTATDRQFLEWSQAQYYNVTGPVLATLPASPASASVTIWYDQSGTAKDAVQGTAANQPAIITAGVIEKNGTRPTIRFAGFPQNLVAPLSTSVYPVSISVLGNTSGNSTGGAFIKLGTSVNAGQAGIAIGIGNSGGTFDSPGTSVVGLKEWVVWSPSSPNVNYPVNPFTSTTIQQAGAGGMTTFLNGTNVPLTGAGNAVGASIAGNLFIGGYTNSFNRFAAVKESEVIVFPTALSTTRRSLLETQQSAYNNITITTNKYTPPTSTSYQKYVNGVGRESVTDSVSGTRSTAGLGFVIGQAGTDFLKDNGDYVTAGMDCPVSGTTALNLPGSIVQRWNNDWYLNVTDVNSNNGTINFFFDFSDYGMSGLPGTSANYDLLYRNSSSGTFSIVPGTAKSVVGDRVMFAVDAAGISTNFYYTLGTSNPTLSPLPIELVSFDLRCVDSGVQINWTTASQYKNDYFSIERTVDGVNFETLGKIKGAGTSSEIKNYSFTDHSPLSGISYYRLKQSDFDNSVNYFELVEISCKSSKSDLSIYPNPGRGLFTLEGAKVNSEIVICNTLGMEVYSQKNVLNKHSLDLTGLPDGIYFVIIQNKSEHSTKKLIIHH